MPFGGSEKRVCFLVSCSFLKLLVFLDSWSLPHVENVRKNLRFPGGTSGKRTSLPTQEMREMWVWSLGPIPGSGRSPGEEMGTRSAVLAWRIAWTEEPGGPQFRGLQTVRRDWASPTHHETIAAIKIVTISISPPNFPSPLSHPFLPLLISKATTELLFAWLCLDQQLSPDLVLGQSSLWDWYHWVVRESSNLRLPPNPAPSLALQLGLEKLS